MKFKQKARNDESSDDVSDNEEMKEDEEEWDISDAVQMIRANDVVLIRSGDDLNPYFPFVANQELFELEEGRKERWAWSCFSTWGFCHNWKFPCKNCRWSILQRC